MLKKIVFSFFLTTTCFGSVSRIAEKSLNISMVNPIYLSFGRVSLVELPCEVKRIDLGLSESFKVSLDEKSKNEVTVSMIGEIKHPSNMLIRCDQYLLVFDLIPSKKIHQANLKVTSLYDNPEEKSSRKVVVER